MGNIIYLKQNAALFAVEAEGKLNGNVKGVAYSGGIIENHGPYDNLIIDLSTTKVAKAKTPILRDHNQSQVAGQGTLKIEDNQVLIDGRLSKRTVHGKEITELAEDGFEWEMSIGIFGFDVQEVTDEEVNGIKLEKGIVLRNGTIREVSLVSLGADMSTKAEVFNFKQGDTMKNVTLSQEQWDKLLLACGCGGDTKPEKLAEEVDEKNKEKKDEVEELKKEIAALKEKLAEYADKEKDEKEKAEMSARKTSIEAALSAKKATFAKEKIEEASKTKEATDLLLGLIEGMTAPTEPTKKIADKFSKKVDLDDGLDPAAKLSAKDIEAKAELLVKEGKAETLFDAIMMVEEGK